MREIFFKGLRFSLALLCTAHSVRFRQFKRMMHQPLQRLQMVNESLLSLTEKGVGELMGPLNEKESKKEQKKFYADLCRLRSCGP